MLRPASGPACGFDSPDRFESFRSTLPHRGRNKMRRLAMALVLALPLAACSTHKAYLNPQFGSTTSAHQQVAILPFDVTISRVRLPKNLTPVDGDARAGG